MELANISYRNNVIESDSETVRNIVTSTNFFNPEEIDIAVELVDEFLLKGKESGYQFIFMESNNTVLGYTCYGKIPGTVSSFAMYWIAVHDDFRNRSFGKVLLQETEKDIFKQGGTGIYVETSSREQYIPTRAFYKSNEYQIKARFDDYYDKGDDLVFFVKKPSYK
ncbi:MAG: GNAT family N-acetyltransferase [Bacteroidetes bacterium]|nr:GNAT family N-acetyltransferase [Bacteroidota bacterium]